MSILLRKTHIILFVIIGCLFLEEHVAFPQNIDTTDDKGKIYKKAWDYVENDEMEKARELVEQNYKTEDGKINVFWLVLESVTYLSEGNYEKALNIIEPFRDGIKKTYYFDKEHPDESTKDGRELVAWNYKKLLTISSVANFKMEKWMAALIDMLEEETNGFDNNYAWKAVCYYNLKIYPEALINLQYYYKSTKPEEIEARDEAAFSIACLYSLLNDVDQSLFWLEIPLKHDIKLWYPKISKEKDFDNIRNNSKFIEFEKRQKQSFEKIE